MEDEIHVICKYEKEIVKTAEDVAFIKSKVENMDYRFKLLDNRINGSLDRFGDHVKDGNFWRGVIITVAVSLIASIMTFNTQYGKLQERVDNNKFHIEKVIEK